MLKAGSINECIETVVRNVFLNCDHGISIILNVLKGCYVSNVVMSNVLKGWYMLNG